MTFKYSMFNTLTYYVSVTFVDDLWKKFSQLSYISNYIFFKPNIITNKSVALYRITDNVTSILDNIH